MIHSFFEYLKFIFRAKNQHGIHSPFVYDLTTNCIYDKTKFKEYRILQNYGSCLLNNRSFIKVEDYGAGSKVFKSNKRRISQIAKNAGITRKRAKLLFRLVRYFNPNSILELGTSVGMSTSAMALGNRNSVVKTVEGSIEVASVAQRQFEKFNLDNIQLSVNKFEDELSKFKTESFDFIFIDGHHSLNPTLSYFEILLKFVNNETVIVFDDIHWSKDMTLAWEEIKNNPKVTVTIDTFNWGIIFFRKEQAKQHFRIRV